VAVVVIVAMAFALAIRPPIKEPAFSHELIAMQREVDSFQVNFFREDGRVSFGAVSQAFEDQQRDAAVVDQQNQDRLNVLLDRYGWPTEKMVGSEAVHAALTVAQRAPDPAFKERALGYMKQAGQDNTPEYARLVDQVAVSKGELQTYGTVYLCRNGRLQLATPIKQTDNLTRLRKSVGLGDYERFRADFCFSDESVGGPATSVVPPPILRTNP
jgi:hypothetical protein